MNIVRFQLYSWIAQILGETNCDSRILEKKVQEGTTVFDLFTELAKSYPQFQKLVFDPDSAEMSSEVLIILNDRPLQVEEIKKIKIRDKDTITLIPVLFGG